MANVKFRDAACSSRFDEILSGNLKHACANAGKTDVVVALLILIYLACGASRFSHFHTRYVTGGKGKGNGAESRTTAFDETINININGYITAKYLVQNKEFRETTLP